MAASTAAPLLPSSLSNGSPNPPNGQTRPPPFAHSNSVPPPIPSSSSAPPKNPQLGPDPWFSYPTPTADQIEDELPPYFEDENVPMGPMLERMVRRGYGDMRVLLEQTLPHLNARNKPKHIIDYAKTTRQAVLKYLAVLRWKTSVDIPSSSTQPIVQNHYGLSSFPTPYSNSESNDTSPGAYVGKGKGRMIEEDQKPIIRGKVTDAKRITHFMEHQNRQHEDAVAHVRHTAKVVEGLRERNADLLTALSLVTLGTYSRLPTNLTESFKPRKPLTNAVILDTLRRLNAHIKYRLRCVDFVPPEMVIDRIVDGRVYVRGGGDYGWEAQITVVGFGDGQSADSRWWLTGLDWRWRNREKGVHDPGGQKRKFSEEELQQILDLANAEVLPPKEVEAGPSRRASLPDLRRKVSGIGGGVESRGLTPSRRGSRARTPEAEVSGEWVDGPLVRLCNFLQHLSLSYQLELLGSQAFELAQGKRRGQLAVEMLRDSKTLRVKYWIRPRPPTAQNQPAANSRRPMPASNSRPPPQSASTSRQPLVGGTLSISLVESSEPDTGTDPLLRAIATGGLKTQERVLRLGLEVKWEVGEAGAGAGLKIGQMLDSSSLRSLAHNLNLEELVTVATRSHSAQLTRAITLPLLSASRISLVANQPLSLEESDSPTALRPVALRVPLPSRHQESALIIGVSALNGLLEIEDTGSRDGQMDERGARARMSTAAVNEGKSRLGEDIARLMAAILTETLEMQMKQLGLHPTRRLPLRAQELANNDLHPAASVFAPLPTSPVHYFVAKVTPQGIAFELLRLSRVSAENGVGMRLVIGDKTPMDMEKLRARRKERGGDGKREMGEEGEPLAPPVLGEDGLPRGQSTFQVEDRDLKDMFILSNALVAQTIVEQQLKDRHIPYTQQYPPASGDGAPSSGSAVAGMVPTLCVKSRDLLKDDRAVNVATPLIYMQIKDWWKGGVCEVVTVVQLRHLGVIPSAGVSPGQSMSMRSKAQADGITLDRGTNVVQILAKDIHRCVPDFLEQWARVSMVIVVAGETDKLKQTDGFRDMRIISFDLRTVNIEYTPGYVVSISYSPQSDCYETTYFRSSALTPATPSHSPEGEPTPHSMMAPLLSYYLNELVTADQGGNKQVGRSFLQLLRSTLALLLEVEAVRGEGEFPALVVLSVEQYRLIWDFDNKRYSMDIHLLPSHNEFLFSDSSVPLSPWSTVDPSCGHLTPFPEFTGLVSKVFGVLKQARQIQGDCHDAVLKRLDGGKSLWCTGSMVGETVRCVVEQAWECLSKNR